MVKFCDKCKLEKRTNLTQPKTQYDHNCRRNRGRVRRLTGVLEKSRVANNEDIETQSNNISNVTGDGCCVACKTQHQSSFSSSPMSAFFHLSFNNEDDSHSSEEELEEINLKGRLQNYSTYCKLKINRFNTCLVLQC